MAKRGLRVPRVVGECYVVARRPQNGVIVRAEGKNFDAKTTSQDVSPGEKGILFRSGNKYLFEPTAGMVG